MEETRVRLNSLTSLTSKENQTHQFWVRVVGGKRLFMFNSTMSSILRFTHQDLHSISCCLLFSEFFAPCFCWWESAPINHGLELESLKENNKEVN